VAAAILEAALEAYRYLSITHIQPENGDAESQTRIACETIAISPFGRLQTTSQTAPRQLPRLITSTATGMRLAAGILCGFRPTRGQKGRPRHRQSNCQRGPSRIRNAGQLVSVSPCREYPRKRPAKLAELDVGRTLLNDLSILVA
jgi:hypothetical protein